MENRELKRVIQETAEDRGINGVMALTSMCDISYERVSRVWGGSVNAKLCDVAHVADVLGMKIKFVGKGNNND